MQVFLKPLLILAIFWLITLLNTSCDSNTSSQSDNDKIGKIPFQTIFNCFVTSKTRDFESVVLTNYYQAYIFLSEHLSDIPDDHILFKVQYSDSLVIGVYTGYRSNNSSSIAVDSVVAYADKIQVYVTEYGSAFGGRIMVWPAHFVTIANKYFNNSNVQFNLTRVCELEPCSWNY